MSLTQYWLSDPVFDLLCNIVASNKLICMTGAGISQSLPLKNSIGKIPNWKQLLEKIHSELKSDLDDDDNYNLSILLNDKPTGEQLIEAATILDKKYDKFINAFYKAIEHKVGATTKVHEMILDLKPRGILTYNYDYAHENALKNRTIYSNWDVLQPFEEDRLINTLRNQFQRPFLLKAHGTLDDKESIVLTRESYRHLLNKCLAYKAFVQNILTNYNLLIVGFGLSDPDFDLFVQYIFSMYGSTLREHVVIKHENEKSPNDTIYHLRYGLNFLYIKDFGDISSIFQDSICTLGSELRKLIDTSINGVTADERSAAHRDIEMLNTNGKSCVENALKQQIQKLINRQHSLNFDEMEELSELVYTIGKLAKYDEHKSVKDFLISEIIEKCEYSEPVAHALITLREGLREDDLDFVSELILRFNETSPKLKVHPAHPDTDPDNRVPIYAKYIWAYLRARYRTFK